MGGGMTVKSWLHAKIAISPCMVAATCLMRPLGRCVLGALMLLAMAVPASAIPSPELVVGSLSSLSQLVALLSGLLGGGALLAGTGLARGRAGIEAARRTARLLGALAGCCLVLLGLNVWQAVEHRSERKQRLEATLLRPAARTSEGATLDDALKELNFAEQSGHPLGMSTAAAAEIVSELTRGTRDDYHLLDVRETAETEMGSLARALPVRIPDLPQSRIDLKSRKALVFCHNGNRSSEVCQRLQQKGIDCRFIVGGLEKWIVEGRSLDGRTPRNLSELRALADYPNNTTLLDTAEAKHLAEKENALFLDVRYPGEFKAGHIRGAINWTLRTMPQDEIRRRIAELPRRPVVVPCYDRRSCFFGEVIGLELTRAGHDFRGRYTVPWEYYQAPSRPPHVEAWLAEAGLGWWQRAARKLSEALAALAGHIGLVPAIGVLALLSRLLILPFSLKAERDQATSRRIEPEVKALRKRLAADPQRLRRAMLELYRRNGLTPARNLVALLFLPVLALSVEAVGSVAGQIPGRLFWIENLAARDVSLALPVVFAALLCTYLHWALARSRVAVAGVWLVAAPLFVLLGEMLPAAACFYLATSAALLLVQRGFAVGGHSRVISGLARMRRGFQERRLLADGIVPLGTDAGPAVLGGKAERLGLLARSGVRVPPGYIIAPHVIAVWSLDGERAARSARRIARALGNGPMAVRSSAAQEDGADLSHAGVFDTRLEVQPGRLEEAIAVVARSFTTAHAASYNQGDGSGSVLIQPMVPARHAGVLFTEAPDAPATMMIEYVEGNGEALVSGAATPRALRVGRLSGAILSGDAPPFDLSGLIALARKIEAICAAPQDIEWAATADGIVVLQSRDITATTSGTGSASGREWRYLAGLAGEAASSDIILRQTTMSELLPEPSPLTLSLIERLWASGGSVDLAARSLGLSYRVGEGGAAYHVLGFGRLYVDAREEARRSLSIARRDVRRITRQADMIEQRVRDALSPAFEERVRVLSAVDFGRLETDEIIAALHRQAEHFLTRTHMEAETVNIAAEILVGEARRALERAGARNAATILDVAASEHLVRMLENALRPDASDQIIALDRLIGHRAQIDYELAEPRYGEQPHSLCNVARRLCGLLDGRSTRLGEVRQDPVSGKGLDETLAQARRFLVLKEEAKHLALREWSLLRRIALALDRRLGLDGDVFHLTIEELEVASSIGVKRLRQISVERRDRLEELRRHEPLPPVVTVDEIERGALRQGRDQVPPAGTALQWRGTRVAGSGPVSGRAFRPREKGLVEEVFAGFQDGDVVVARMLNPAWLGYVLRSGGVVTQVGGWLSHMAIIARERGIVMITGVSRIDGIETGALVTLNDDGVVSLSDLVVPDREMRRASAGGVINQRTHRPAAG